MPRFRYEAVNRWGDPFQGEREAEDRQDLVRSLEAEKLELRVAEQLPDDHQWVHATDADQAPLLSDQDMVEPIGPKAGEGWIDDGVDWDARSSQTRREDRLTEEDARELAEQLAGLSAAGVPLSQGLRAAAEEVRDGALRRALLDLADHLDAGQAPDEALEQIGGRLPGHLRGLVLAAARSGRVGTVLGEFVGYAQLADSLRRSLWLALAYPTLLMAFLVLVFGFACVVVIPNFKSIYYDFGVQLPVLTLLLIAASDAIVERGPALLALTVSGTVVIWVAARFLLDSASRRHLVCSIPLYGSLWRWTALAEFSHYLGLLVDCELTMSRALPLAAGGARDPELSRACAIVADQVAAGRPLSEALSLWPVVPQGLVKLLRWSEGRQSLGEALHMAGMLFETRARAQASVIGAVVLVFAVSCVILGAGVLIVGLFLPLFRLISVLA